MYILEYLAGKYGNLGDKDSIVTEYRLLCSGELYNGRVQTFDWRKSDVTRILLRAPCALRVVSQPFDDYPQELSLLIVAPHSVTETRGDFSIVLRPDDQIVEDLVSLLTLFLRRLVTVFAKVRVRYPHNFSAPLGLEKPEPSDLHLPIANPATRVAWKTRGISVMWMAGKVESLTDHKPRPLPVHPDDLESKLGAVPKLTLSSAYIPAARLYAQAMRLIEDWPDVAYQRLISAVETLASDACSVPTRDAVLTIRSSQVENAVAKGVPRQTAEELVLQNSKNDPWTSRKFRAFLQKMTDGTVHTDDDLFMLAAPFRPDPAKFEDSLKQITETRGADLHSGHGYGPSVSVGIESRIPVEAVQEAFSGGPSVPPVVWFERVVNVALNRYLQEALNHPSDWTLTT